MELDDKAFGWIPPDLDSRTLAGIPLYLALDGLSPEADEALAAVTNWVSSAPGAAQDTLRMLRDRDYRSRLLGACAALCQLPTAERTDALWRQVAAVVPKSPKLIGALFLLDPNFSDRAPSVVEAIAGRLHDHNSEAASTEEHCCCLLALRELARGSGPPIALEGALDCDTRGGGAYQDLAFWLAHLRRLYRAHGYSLNPARFAPWLLSNRPPSESPA